MGMEDTVAHAISWYVVVLIYMGAIWTVVLTSVKRSCALWFGVFGGGPAMRVFNSSSPASTAIAAVPREDRD